MAEIDIKKLKNIKDELAFLDEEEALFIQEDGQDEYVILRENYYQTLEAYKAILDGAKYAANNNIKIVSNELNELTYDEYEDIKKQLNDIFDKTFKPKADKLN